MDELALDINEAIKSSECYKRYLYYKNIIENDKNLNDIKSKMEKVKKLNCVSKSEDYVKEYYDLEKKYYDSVIVKEYQKSKDEVYSLLKDISDILSLK